MKYSLKMIYQICIHILLCFSIFTTVYQYTSLKAQWNTITWKHTESPLGDIPLPEPYAQNESNSVYHTAYVNDQIMLNIKENDKRVFSIYVQPPGAKSQWIFETATPEITEGPEAEWSVTIDNYDTLNDIKTNDPYAFLKDDNCDGIPDGGLWMPDGPTAYYGEEVWTILVPKIRNR